MPAPLRARRARSRLRGHGGDPRLSNDARARAARGGAHRKGSVEGMGSLSERASVGDGARGLQPGWRRLGLLLPRSGPVACLSVGRGRHRRDLRRAPAAVPVTRAMERRRSDPEGADVRAHQQPGQPRRGRQGVLVLPRQHPDALLSEVPVQVPAAGLPLRGPGGHQRAPRQAGHGVRAPGHRDLRRGPLLRRGRRVRQGRLRRHPHAGHRAQPRPGGGVAAPAADAVVSQHVVVGRRGREAHPDGRGRRRRARRPPGAGGVAAARRPLGAAAVLRERDQQRAPVRRPERLGARQGRHQRLRRRRRRRRGQPGPHGHQGGGPPRAGGGAGRERLDPGAPDRGLDTG